MEGHVLIEADITEAVLSVVNVDRLSEWQGLFPTVVHCELHLLLKGELRYYTCRERRVHSMGWAL